MSCQCKPKKRLQPIEIIDTEVVTGTSVVLTIRPGTFRNACAYVIINPFEFPLEGQDGTEIVTITDGTTTYEAQDPIGNDLVSGFLRGRNHCYEPRVYRVIYGSNPQHFQFKEIDCCLRYTPASTAPAEPGDE